MCVGGSTVTVLRKAFESTRTPLVNPHPTGQLAPSHPDQHARLPRLVPVVYIESGRRGCRPPVFAWRDGVASPAGKPGKPPGEAPNNHLRRCISAENVRKYTRQRNKVRSMTRKLQCDQEKMISQNAKSNPKKFWNYVNSRLKTRSGIADLEMDDTVNGGTLATTDQAKADTLSKFFSSVFTREPDTDIPLLDVKHYQVPLDTINIAAVDVRKELSRTKISQTRSARDLRSPG